LEFQLGSIFSKIVGTNFYSGRVFLKYSLFFTIHENAKNDVEGHFADVSNMVEIGYEAKREINDIMLL